MQPKCLCQQAVKRGLYSRDSHPSTLWVLGRFDSCLGSFPEQCASVCRSAASLVADGAQEAMCVPFGCCAGCRHGTIRPLAPATLPQRSQASACPEPYIRKYGANASCALAAAVCRSWFSVYRASCNIARGLLPSSHRPVRLCQAAAPCAAGMMS